MRDNTRLLLLLLRLPVYSLHNTEPIAPSRSSAPVQAHDVSESCPLGVILSLHMAGSVPSGMTKATERNVMASVTPVVR